MTLTEVFMDLDYFPFGRIEASDLPISFKTWVSKSTISTVEHDQEY